MTYWERQRQLEVECAATAETPAAEDDVDVSEQQQQQPQPQPAPEAAALWRCGHCEIVYAKTEADLARHLSMCVRVSEDDGGGESSMISVSEAGAAADRRSEADRRSLLKFVAAQFALNERLVQGLLEQQHRSSSSSSSRRRRVVGPDGGGTTGTRQSQSQSQSQGSLAALASLSANKVSYEDVRSVCAMLAARPVQPELSFADWVYSRVATEENVATAAISLESGEDVRDLLFRDTSASSSSPSAERYAQSFGLLFREVLDAVLRALAAARASTSPSSPPPPVFALDVGPRPQMGSYLRETHARAGGCFPLFVYEGAERGWRPMQLRAHAGDVLVQNLLVRIGAQISAEGERALAAKESYWDTQLQELERNHSELSRYLSSLNTKKCKTKALLPDEDGDPESAVVDREIARVTTQMQELRHARDERRRLVDELRQPVVRMLRANMDAEDDGFCFALLHCLYDLLRDW